LDNGIRLLTITEELAESLVGAGCRQISVGVESGNAEIMHRIKKPLTIPGLFKKMEMMKQFPEIYVKGNFIVGFPFENYDQLQDTFRIATEVDFDWRIFSTYSPLVGTEALNYFDDETKAEIDYSENSFGSCETIPDGFSSEDEFRDKVYLENLRINFLENPNYKGKNLQRALNDFTRIVRDNDADHALALYCIHNIYKSLGETNKHAKYLNQFNEVINNSAQWRVYCDQLNVPISIA